MGKFGKKLLSIIMRTMDLEIPVYASHASFFIVLSVFPSLLLLMSLLRYTGLEVSYLIQLLEGVVPKALLPGAQRLILNTYRNTTGVIVSISAITALWSASRGVHGLCTGLNRVYGITDQRGYIRSRLFSVFYTFAFLLVLALTLVLNVFGNTLPEWIPESSQVLEGIMNMRFFVLLGVQMVLFTTMYSLLPAEHNRLLDSLPGAVFSSLGWMIFSNLYSIYVEKLATPSNIFGPVYAVALSMLWLYFCVSIIFYGGALNHWLASGKHEDYTEDYEDEEDEDGEK